MTKILLTTDGSPQATNALQAASRLFRQEEWQADVLCVAPEPAWPQIQGKSVKAKVAQLSEQYQQQIKLEAHKVLTQAQVLLLAADSLEAGALVELGSPAKVILQQAGNYDVVVLGAHAKYAPSEPGLGPVASRVVAQCPNAVLVAREMSADRSLRVLAGVDGSLAAEQALRLWADYFNADTAEITLLHVVETPWLKLGLERDWFGSVTGQSDPTQRFDHELRAEAEAVLESARTLLEAHGLSAQTMVENGDPALELLSEAENGAYDLIVLGASSEADVKHSLLGSVSTRVAQDASCSVFIAKFVG